MRQQNRFYPVIKNLTLNKYTIFSLLCYNCNTIKARTRMESPEISAHHLSEVLKKYMEKEKKTIYRIEKETGINRRTLERVIKNNKYDPQFEATMKKLYSYMNWQIVGIPPEDWDNE